MNFITSFLSFVKLVILGEHLDSRMSLQKATRYFVYFLFVTFMTISYHSSKNLHILNKKYKLLLKQNTELQNKQKTETECVSKLDTTSKALQASVKALEHKCPSMIYVDKTCSANIYGNFTDK